MFQLLIVDDEKSVVDSLALTVPWHDYAISEVFEAYSAAEALDIVSRCAIDIVITDIRMPEMNGLELIDRLSEGSGRMKHIVLTGYDDFHYAQQALKKHAHDYLLKPVVMDELIASVTRAVEQLTQEWKTVSSMQRVRSVLRANLPILRDHLLQDLLNNKSVYYQSLIERLAYLELPFAAGDEVTMMLIRMEDGFAKYDLKTLSLLEYAVTNIAEEVFSSAFDLWHCTSEHDYLVFLIKNKDGVPQELLESCAVKLQNNIQYFLHGSVSVYISQPAEFPSQVSAVYNASVSYMNKTMGINKGLFITASHEEVASPEPVSTLLYESPQLIHLLDANRWDEIDHKIAHIFAESMTASHPAQESSLNVFLYFSSAFSYFANKNGLNPRQVLGEEFDLLMKRPAFLTLSRLQEWVKTVVAFLKENTLSQIQTSREHLLMKIHSFIDTHLSAGITLQSIADHVHLHPVYISKIFKLMTGETISDYLLSVRMEKAAHLLNYTDLKIYEICAQLGYYAPAHFIKLFKKHFQATPQEYRNQLREKDKPVTRSPS